MADLDLAAAERELCRIPDVRAARLVADPRGSVVEVHVLALPGTSADEVARAVQSVARSSSDLTIDADIISVVQLEDAGPGAQLPADPPGGRTGTALAPLDAPSGNDNGIGGDAESPPALPAGGDIPLPQPRRDGDRVAIESVVAQRRGLRCTAEVTLRRGERATTGSAEGSAASSATLRLVAEATVQALSEVEPEAANVAVETTSIARVGERWVAVVAVVLVSHVDEELLTGSAPVRAIGEHEAVARAVLDATNRRLSLAG